jgi:ubiquinone/menaquinone biosynthesis C-methylase UbiE
MAPSMNTGAEALEGSQELFTREWQVYRKMVANDYLFHRDAYGHLNRVLVEDVNRPFALLDVACGDASMTSEALRGTQIISYCGIDISEQALAIAQKNLATLECPIRLEEGDFVEAFTNWTGNCDIVWIGLSLHHLRAPGKLEIMRRIRNLMISNGCLLIYENTSPDGESRKMWLKR